MSYLKDPSPGTWNASPTCHILLAFPHVTSDWRDDLHVRINDTPVIEEGRELDGISILSLDHGRVRFKPDRCTWPEHVFVQASCEGHQTHNARFLTEDASTKRHPRFVHGSRTGSWHITPEAWHLPHGTYDAPDGPEDAPQYITSHNGGYFAIYPEKGVLQWAHSRQPTTHTFRSVQNPTDIAVTSHDNAWHLALKNDTTFQTSSAETTTRWDFVPPSIQTSQGYWHVRYDALSYHLPLEAGQWPHATTLESWYMSEQYPEGTLHFDRNMAVWHAANKMIVRHDFEPVTDTSKDMLWTSDDIPALERFDDVKIIDDSHVLVNDTWFLNTRHPDYYAR